ncbi:MAG TPA: ABC transporter permease [Candidatus Dormibacteraeota bacterium]|nr:ABC transporter permease [Candidatus Dormibacteraeota bacterium]
MARFLLRRLLNYVVLVAMATTLGYFLAGTTLHPRSNYEGRNPPLSASSINRQLDDLNLNDHTPIVRRFGRWLGGVVHGDFGKTVTGDSVTAEMGRRIGVSLRLLVIGSFLGGLLGVGVGVLGAVRQYHFSDHASAVLSFVILSTPVFLVAVLLKLAALNLNQVTGVQLLDYTGEYTPGLSGGWAHLLLDRVRHLILPTLSIVLGQIAFYSRYQRNAMLDVLGSDFLRTAQAKGLRRNRALIKHGLRTALIPMATFFAYNFGLLITGATFTEKIFGWHGMGEWFVDSVTTNDVNAVVTVTLFVAVLVLIAGMLSDLAYAALDPRVRIR